VLIVLYSAVGLRYGWSGMLFLACQSAVAFLLIETINYIEHYGLVRREVAPGQYERVMPWHSWDSTHRVSNWILINLARHADHHVAASKRYQVLYALDAAPQLPTGYGAMFVLALAPPLWRRVMDPRVERWRKRYLD
jgi:alkane 1-monooxygenase